MLAQGAVYVSIFAYRFSLTLARYTTPACSQPPWTGQHGVPPSQLQVFFSGAGLSPCNTLLLCLAMDVAMFGMHLYPILSVCLLKSLFKGLFGGNALSTKARNSFPTFVLTWREYGGLKYGIFLFMVETCL